MFSLTGLLLFAGLVRFAWVTLITLSDDPRALMFVVTVSCETCCTAVADMRVSMGW